MTELEEYRYSELAKFQSINRISFHDVNLLNCAFIHKSYRNETLHVAQDNERLEFLGDSILNFLVTDLLYREYLGLSEGKLSKIKSFITSGEFLFQKARRMNIGEYLLLGKGEEATGGRDKMSLLSNAYEAFIGALYLDGGIRKAKAFIKKQFLKEIKTLGAGPIVFDYKAALQEYIQNKASQPPRYNIEKVTGPEHDKEYHVSITIGGKTFGPEKGHTRKQAEKRLAKRVLDELLLIKDV